MINYIDQSTNLRYSSKSVANGNKYFLLLVLAEQLVKLIFVFTVRKFCLYHKHGEDANIRILYSS